MSFGIKASSIDISKLNPPKLPKPSEDNRIKVLSGLGYATQYLEPISEEFINYSSNLNIPVIDVGAAYGLTTINALHKGAIVITNELYKDNLDYIVSLNEITNEERERLYLKEGSILNIDFPENSIGAIHLARVMHFFHPNEIKTFFENCNKWLIDKGRIYLSTMSQYHYGNPKDFYIKYNENLKKGIEYPGEISNYEFKEDNYYLHAIDPFLICNLANKYNFTVKKVELWGGNNDDDYTCAILIKNYHH